MVPALGALVLRRRRPGSVSRLVLACASDRGAVLSASFFWRGRFSNHECRMVLGNQSADGVLQFVADAFHVRDHRRDRCAARKTYAAVSLVARRDAAVHSRRRLRQSPSMVSTSAGPDCGRLCWMRLWVDRPNWNPAAAARSGSIAAHRLVCRVILFLRPTALPTGGGVAPRS